MLEVSPERFKEFDRGCLGKTPHESESAAAAAQGYWVRNGTVRSGDECEPYLCKFCEKWHLGH
jgi:hypothetical protein